MLEMRMTTCVDGIGLMEMGLRFWAWDPETYNEGITQVDIEVPDGAYEAGEVVDDNGNQVNEYRINKPELVKIVSEKY
jgi:hypothetical protein